MELIYKDDDIVVCIKPAGALSTDEPGGVPELVRQALGDEKIEIRTVHRLDRVVSGLMVLARNADAAAELSRQIRDNEFHKEYLAVLHGIPDLPSGTYTDLLLRNKPERKTYVVAQPGKDVQEAILHYELIEKTDQILADDATFYLINMYTTGLSPAVMSYMISSIIEKTHGGKIEAEDIGLPVRENGLVLPCGSSARWSR
jgi:23S rRNA-/tRNA-specific pseudouridylate synthase